MKNQVIRIDVLVGGTHCYSSGQAMLHHVAQHSTLLAEHTLLSYIQLRIDFYSLSLFSFIPTVSLLLSRRSRTHTCIRIPTIVSPRVYGHAKIYISNCTHDMQLHTSIPPF